MSENKTEIQDSKTNTEEEKRLLRECLQSKQNIKVIRNSFIIVFLLISLHPLWLSLYDKYIIKPILSEIRYETTTYDILFILFLLVSVVSIISYLKKDKPTQSVRAVDKGYCFSPSYVYKLVMGSSLIGFYIYHRLFTDSYEYYNLISGLAYTDLLILLFGFYSLGNLRNVYQLIHTPTSINQVNNTMLEDLPLMNADDDKLDKKHFSKTAEKITGIILNNNFHKAFTIGLSGIWGEGKSSIFNLCKLELEERAPDIRLIDFSPWIGFDKRILIKDFFERIAENIDSSFSSDFIHYANQVIDSEYNNDIMRFTKSLFSKNISLEERFEILNNRIKLLNKKIVVFIDDVDRLDKEEIFEVLKLIRKTANFHNFFFVIAYDRNYVNKSIADFNSSITHQYLDKIINVEINLPYYNGNELFAYFISELRSIKDCSESKIKALEQALSKNRNKEDFVYWINNFRDIIKILNSIKATYKITELDLNLYDVLNLEILKLKHPYLYSLIYSQKDHLLNIDGEMYFFRIQNDFANNRIGKIKDENSEKIVLQEYLERYSIENNIHEEEQKQIIKLINNLFPKSKINKWMSSKKLLTKIESEKRNYVCYVQNFERYFSHVIPSNKLDDDDFKKIETETDKEKFDELIERLYLYKEEDFSFRIRSLQEFNDTQHFKNYFYISLYLIEKTEKPNQINNHLTDVSRKIISLKIKNINDNDKLKRIVIELFNNLEVEQLYYGTQILENLKEVLVIRHPAESGLFPLSLEQINTLQETYVLKYLESNEKFNEEFWILYANSKNKNILSDSKFSEINKKIVNKTEDLTVLESLLESSMQGDLFVWKKHVDYMKDIKDIYGSFEEFEDLLNKHKELLNSDTLKEFDANIKKLLENELTEKISSGEIPSIILDSGKD